MLEVSHDMVTLHRAVRDDEMVPGRPCAAKCFCDIGATVLRRIKPCHQDPRTLHVYIGTFVVEDAAAVASERGVRIPMRE